MLPRVGGRHFDTAGAVVGTTGGSANTMSEGQAKYVLVVAGDPDAGEFTDRLIRYMADLPGTAFTHIALPEQADQKPEGSGAPSSVIVEWFASEAPAPDQWADALSVEVDQLNWYAVSENLRWHRPGTSRSSTTGISHICCVERTAGLTEAQFEQHWTSVHRPLAQKHHIGMELYVQSVVRRRLGAGGPGIDGIAELGFPSVGSFETEMYDSDDGLETIKADVFKFVGAASCGLYRLVP
jgi:uncharacterized protein (TIGR02118 family)